jgi:hypothetical protein
MWESHHYSIRLPQAADRGDGLHIGEFCRYKPYNKIRRRARKVYLYSLVKGKGSSESCKKENVTQCLELTGSCQGGYELSGSIRAGQFLEQLGNY